MNAVVWQAVGDLDALISWMTDRQTNKQSFIRETCLLVSLLVIQLICPSSVTHELNGFVSKPFTISSDILFVWLALGVGVGVGSI